VAAVTHPPATEAPAVPRRALTIGPSIARSKSAGSGLAGFEGATVQKATEFQGRIDIEPSTTEVRPGDPYTIQATFTNLSRKPVKLKDATLTFVVNGRPREQSVEPAAHELQPQATTRIADTGGVWEEDVYSWSLTIAVTTDKGDLCKREIKLR
jgi:hypothetical protein